MMTMSNTQEKQPESLDQQCPTDTDSLIRLAKETEEQSQYIISTIQNLINAIRSIKAFSSTACLDQLRQRRQNINNNSTLKNEEEEIVYFYQTLVNEYPDIIQGIDTISNHSKQQDGETTSSTITSSSSSNIQHMHPLQQDRWKLVHYIFIPLVSSLTQAYTILDSLPPQILSSSNHYTNDTTTTTTLKQQHTPILTNTKYKTNHKPDPPIGMLSLSNYTDVACLLELLISTSILPLLEKNILHSVDHRTKHLLPKTLAGRIPKQSLVWGTSANSYTPKLKSSSSTTTIAESGCKQNPLQQQQQRHHHHYQFKKIQSSRLELQHTATAITQLLLLDRFRPMLLPRHIAEIYAAVFQVERLDYLSITMMVGNGSSNGNSNSTEDCSSNFYEHLLVDHSCPCCTIQYQNVCNLLLPSPSSTVVTTAGIPSPENNLLSNHVSSSIDSHLKAKTFQTLLLSGMKSPPWLKTRIGNLLTSLATSTIDGLIAIIDVFVVAASTIPTEDITRASSRLGKVLCTVPTTNVSSSSLPNSIPHITSCGDVYYQLLFSNMCCVLELLTDMKNDDTSFTSSHPQSHSNIPTRSVACILTIWAILDHAPQNTLEEIFFPLWTDGLAPLYVNEDDLEDTTSNNSTTSQHVLKALKRIHSLFLLTPPKSERGSGCSLGPLDLLCRFCFVKNIFSSKVKDELASNTTTVVSQLISISSSSSNKTLFSAIKNVSANSIKLLLNNLITKCIPTDENMSSNTYMKSAVVAIVNNINLSSWDKNGYRFDRTISSSGCETICVKNRRHDVKYDVTIIAADLEQRVMFLTNEVLSTISSLDDQDNGPMSQNLRNSLLSHLFQYLLLIYFESSASDTLIDSNTQRYSFLPNATLRNIFDFKIISMLMIPLFCEKFSPITLILEDVKVNEQSSSGILKLISLIILSTSKSLHKNSFDLSGGGDTVPPHLYESLGYSDCDMLGQSNCTTSATINYNNDSLIDDDIMSESKISIVSVILSLLVAILELGNSQRSRDDEIILKSMLKPLEVFSVLHSDATPLKHLSEGGYSREEKIENQKSLILSTVMKSELAEMASHAMALISTRSDSTKLTLVGSPTCTSSSIFEQIEQAEIHLSSEQPPLRAKAVVSLRIIARGYLPELLNTESNPNLIIEEKHTDPFNDRVLITEISSDTLDKKAESKDDSFYAIIESLLRVTFLALNDDESYVYLAGIQTIVAIVDIHPSYVIPILVQAMSTGSVTFSKLLESNPETAKIQISDTQRIKLTDAIIFSIRRRGQAIQHYASMIFHTLLYGIKATSDQHSYEGKLYRDIQGITHSYFQEGSYALDEKNDDTDNILAEKQIRMNTGGPVFDIEENDLVRAGHISIIAELLSVMNSNLVASHCPSLIRLAKNALCLDESRPIRRAASLLSREIYFCAYREYFSLKDDMSDICGSDLNYLVALIGSDENSLRLTLERSSKSNDVDTITPAVNGKVRLHDQAVVARCNEALTLRDIVDGYGLFDVASLILNGKVELDKNPISKLLREKKTTSIHW